MIEEVSSIFWGLSIAINIILLLFGLPLCLLICCCCRKHQSAIEKDIKSIVANHNLIDNNQPVQPQIQYVPVTASEVIQVPPQQGVTQRVPRDQNQSQYYPQQQNQKGAKGPGGSGKEESGEHDDHEVRKRPFPGMQSSFSLDDNELVE